MSSENTKASCHEAMGALSAAFYWNIAMKPSSSVAINNQISFASTNKYYRVAMHTLIMPAARRTREIATTHSRWNRYAKLACHCQKDVATFINAQKRGVASPVAAASPIVVNVFFLEAPLEASKRKYSS